jgi:hypothetical protein
MQALLTQEPSKVSSVLKQIDIGIFDFIASRFFDSRGVTFGDLFTELTTRKLGLPLGLLRETHSQDGNAAKQRYVYTCPSKETLLRATDKVFLLATPPLTKKVKDKHNNDDLLQVAETELKAMLDDDEGTTNGSMPNNLNPPLLGRQAGEEEKEDVVAGDRDRIAQLLQSETQATALEVGQALSNANGSSLRALMALTLEHIPVVYPIKPLEDINAELANVILAELSADDADHTDVSTLACIMLASQRFFKLGVTTKNQMLEILRKQRLLGEEEGEIGNI